MNILTIFAGKYSYFMNNNFNSELQRIVDAAIKSTIDISNVSSIKDLYDSRKKELGLNDNQIQLLLKMDKNIINPILNGTAKHINILNIIKLGHFLGLSVSDLMKIYVLEMPPKQIGDIQRSREAGYIVENFDIQTLTKIKFLKKGAETTEISDKIKSYFGFDSIFNFTENPILSVYSKTKRNSSNKIRNFWVQSAFIQFKLINNPNEYNRDKLVELIPKIRPFSRDIEYGLIKVAKALYTVGVTVIFQPSIERLQVRGATFSCNNKPCIVISDFQKNYPTLWFTLLHELHHVLYDFEEINTYYFHLSGDADLFLINEEKADKFARDYFLDNTRFKYIEAYIDSKTMIEHCAEKWSIHPSIIYAFYCYETNQWARYSKYIPKMDEALKLLNTHPFEKDTLMEPVKQIKELIYNI